MPSDYGYKTLESQGLWKSPNSVIEQAVIVKLGNETLTILGESSSVFAHWSLNTLIQLEPVNSYSCFAHNSFGNEYLLIDDESMLEVLETIAPKSPEFESKASFRWWGFIKFISFFVVILGTILYFSENIAASIADGVVGQKRTEIGEYIFSEILSKDNETHQLCTVDSQILNKISKRLFPDDRIEIRIVSGGVHSAVLLPGNILVAKISEFEITGDKPEVLAGMLFMAYLRDKSKDSLVIFLQDAGILASFQLLIGREISPYIFEQFSKKLGDPPTIAVSEKQLYQQFSKSNLSTDPFALYLLAENLDPEKFVNEPDEEAHITFPLLEDHEWVSLQNSC